MPLSKSEYKLLVTRDPNLKDTEWDYGSGVRHEVRMGRGAVTLGRCWMISLGGQNFRSGNRRNRRQLFTSSLVLRKLVNFRGCLIVDLYSVTELIQNMHDTGTLLSRDAIPWYSSYIRGLSYEKDVLGDIRRWSNYYRIIIFRHLW